MLKNCKIYFSFKMIRNKLNVFKYFTSSTGIRNKVRQNNKPEKQNPSIENFSANDFINYIKQNIPLSLNTKKIVKPDENMTCFVPINDIISRAKAVGIGKQFLEDLVKYLNDGSQEVFINNNLYEENFCNKINLNLDKLIDLKNSHLKYKFYFKNTDITNTVFIKNKNKNILTIPKKTNFQVNLYKIKNYICLGIEPDRKQIKNLKLFNFHKDVFVKNPLAGEKGTDIKADVISFKDQSKLIGQQHENIPLCLLSQFDYTLISDKDLILVVEINDELNDLNTKHELSFNSIEFKVECVIFKMNYKEMQKFDKESKIRNEKGVINMEEFNTVNTNNLDLQNLSVTAFINNQKFNEKFKYEFKIVDVDNFLDGNKLI
jgi:hypothetical protein